MDSDKNRKMDYTVLFILLIITVTQTTSLDHHCNSDVHSSASGMDELQKPTTLQYCLIDNCTIIRNDTRQQLDIVCTTQSHLVVTPNQWHVLGLLLLFDIFVVGYDFGTGTYQHTRTPCTFTNNIASPRP